MGLRHITESDVAYLSKHMKPQDVLELKAALGVSPLVGLERSIASSSEAHTLEVDGRPVAIGGVTQTQYGGLAWVLTVDNVKSFGRELTTYAKLLSNQYLDQYGQLYNYVALSNVISLRWLERLGFKRGEECSFNGVPFVLMYKRRN
ncbi:DUF2833 domain-containing protein [Vibrio parahaemolyticus]|uniref:phage protein Gp13 family protein n=1 Tax=Vibrio parahaemolyticus TaxID=670 RepID=UPI00211A3F2B|nr:phage protein Gp13 family protein [Vibrio parahaemolyticus]MCQ9040242.1 DUF2833 domain-containing protein [Vibrio parahaemolyticus]